MSYSLVSIPLMSKLPFHRSVVWSGWSMRPICQQPSKARSASMSSSAQCLTMLQAPIDSMSRSHCSIMGWCRSSSAAGLNGRRLVLCARLHVDRTAVRADGFAAPTLLGKPRIGGFYIGELAEQSGKRYAFAFVSAGCLVCHDCRLLVLHSSSETGGASYAFSALLGEKTVLTLTVNND